MCCPASSIAYAQPETPSAPGWIVLTFFSLLLIGGCQSSTSPSPSEAVRKIEQVSAARAEAFNNGNAEKIATYFTEDAILMAPGRPADTGRVAVEEYYQSIFDAYETELSSRYVDVEVSGDLAYGRGIAKVTLTPKDGGESVTSTSKYLNILEKQPDGRWRTTHDIWNANAPATGE